MDPIGKWEFAITMMIGGMGGTLLMLWLLSFVINLLKKVFPLSKELDKAE
jgi:Na+-transporting methylmalonyl-CoA/oxaloacetate decarboxylase gamma subunit